MIRLGALLLTWGRRQSQACTRARSAAPYTIRCVVLLLLLAPR
jgi:hypothetical protein